MKNVAKSRAQKEVVVMWVFIYLILSFVYLSWNPLKWNWSGPVLFILFGLWVTYIELWKRFWKRN